MRHLRTLWWAAALCIVLLSSFPLLRETAAGVEPSTSGAPEGQTVCSELLADIERLKCYDKQATDDKGRPQERPDAALSTSTSQPSLMGVRWELDSGTSHGLFSIRPHRQVYLLPVRYTTDVNKQPSSPTQGTLSQPLDYINTEVKFQFSAKLKAIELPE